VGFPGETKDDFQMTVKLLDSLLFDYIELYQFSPRPNTEASKLDDQLPEEVIKKRYNRLYVKSLINVSKKRSLHGRRRSFL
jgi:tRNA-2-methylthio-N6-dimethylallyladenosine synthase